jgi:GNAT superfamily N-acetyltransferase
MRKIFVKALAAGLAVVVFLTNSVFANAVATNLWSERKRAQVNQRSTSRPILLASLPDVNAVVGAARPNASFPSSLRRQIPAGGELRYASLLKALPAACGTVREIVSPVGRNAGKTVIYLQDVHLNREAQANLGKTLQALMDAKLAEVVGLEGAFEPIDFSAFRKFPYPRSVKAVADYFLAENRISGPIYAAFTNLAATSAFVGVDQREHYNANVEAYKQAAPLAAGAIKQNEQALQWLAREKEKHFNRALLAFDQQVDLYREGKTTWGEYITLLSRHAAPSKPVALFLEALRDESALNFAAVQAERAALVRHLLGKMNDVEKTGLTNDAVAFRLGNITNADFYARLKTLCARHDLALARYPAMDAYVRYVLLSDAIDADRVLADVSKMEQSVYAALAVTPRERQLLAQSRRLSLSDKLIHFSLSPDEWAQYEALAADPALVPFERFYREAQARNAAMADNLLRAMDSNKTSVAVLVTGGFHSSGITELLKQRGVTSIVFTPKISKVESGRGSEYLSVFTQNKTPLDQLFQGQKLFTAPLVLPGRTLDVIEEASAATAVLRGAEPKLATENLPEPDAHVMISGDSAICDTETHSVSVAASKEELAPIQKISISIKAQTHGGALDTFRNAALRRLVDFLALRDPLPAKADLLLFLGCDDFRVMYRAIRHYKEGRVSHIMIAGGRGSLTNDLIAQAAEHGVDISDNEKESISEAEIIGRYFKSQGVPASAIDDRERTSRNTPENIDNALPLIEAMRIEGRPVQSIIMMQTPLRQRRADATARKRLPASYAIFNDTVDDMELTGKSEQELLQLAFGPRSKGFALDEFEKLATYAAKGDIAPTEFPEDVKTAVEFLTALRPSSSADSSSDPTRRAFLGAVFAGIGSMLLPNESPAAQARKTAAKRSAPSASIVDNAILNRFSKVLRTQRGKLFIKSNSGDPALQNHAGLADNAMAAQLFLSERSRAGLAEAVKILTRIQSGQWKVRTDLHTGPGVAGSLSGYVDAVDADNGGFPPGRQQDWQNTVDSSSMLQVGIAAINALQLARHFDEAGYQKGDYKTLIKLAERVGDYALELRNTAGGVRHGPWGNPAHRQDQHAGHDLRFPIFPDILTHADQAAAYFVWNALADQPKISDRSKKKTYRDAADRVFAFDIKTFWNARESRFLSVPHEIGFSDRFFTKDQALSLSLYGVKKLATTGITVMHLARMFKHLDESHAVRDGDGKIIGYDFTSERRQYVSLELTAQVAAAKLEFADYLRKNFKQAQLVDSNWDVYVDDAGRLLRGIAALAPGKSGGLADVIDAQKQPAVHVDTLLGWASPLGESINALYCLAVARGYDPAALGGGNMDLKGLLSKKENSRVSAALSALFTMIAGIWAATRLRFAQEHNPGPSTLETILASAPVLDERSGVGRVVPLSTLFEGLDARGKQMIAGSLFAIDSVVFPSEQNDLSYWEELLEDGLEEFYAVVDDQNKVQSFAEVRRGSKMWELSWFATTPSYQKRGAGTLLLDVVIAQARAAGIVTLHWLATDSIAFYQSYLERKKLAGELSYTSDVLDPSSADTEFTVMLAPGSSGSLVLPSTANREEAAVSESLDVLRPIKFWKAHEALNDGQQGKRLRGIAQIWIAMIFSSSLPGALVSLGVALASLVAQTQMPLWLYWAPLVVSAAVSILWGFGLRATGRSDDLLNARDPFSVVFSASFLPFLPAFLGNYLAHRRWNENHSHAALTIPESLDVSEQRLKDIFDRLDRIPKAEFHMLNGEKDVDDIDLAQNVLDKNNFELKSLEDTPDSVLLAKADGIRFVEVPQGHAVGARADGRGETVIFSRGRATCSCLELKTVDANGHEWIWHAHLYADWSVNLVQESIGELLHYLQKKGHRGLASRLYITRNFSGLPPAQDEPNLSPDQVLKNVRAKYQELLAASGFEFQRFDFELRDRQEDFSVDAVVTPDLIGYRGYHIPPDPEWKTDGYHRRRVVAWPGKERVTTAKMPLHRYQSVDDVESQNVYADIVGGLKAGAATYQQRYIEGIKKSHSAFHLPWDSDFSADRLPSRERLFHEALIRDESGIYWIVKKQKTITPWGSQDAGFRSEKNDPRYEHLAYLLAQGRANVADIRRIKRAEIKSIAAFKSLRTADLTSYYLVRVVTEENMQGGNVPQRDLSSAFAALLVANVFFRKWDSHILNVGYAGETPVALDQDEIFRAFVSGRNWLEFVYFFVNHSIFSTAEPLLKIDPGHPKNIFTHLYKVRIAQPSLKPGLELLRVFQNFMGTFHLGAGLANAEMWARDALARAIAFFKSLSSADVENAVRAAGFGGDEALELVSIILAHQATLARDVHALIEFITNPTYELGSEAELLPEGPAQTQNMELLRMEKHIRERGPVTPLLDSFFAPTQSSKLIVFALRDLIARHALPFPFEIASLSSDRLEAGVRGRYFGNGFGLAHDISVGAAALVAVHEIFHGKIRSHVGSDVQPYKLNELEPHGAEMRLGNRLLDLAASVRNAASVLNNNPLVAAYLNSAAEEIEFGVHQSRQFMADAAASVTLARAQGKEDALSTYYREAAVAYHEGHRDPEVDPDFVELLLRLGSMKTFTPELQQKLWTSIFGRYLHAVSTEIERSETALSSEDLREIKAPAPGEITPELLDAAKGLAASVESGDPARQILGIMESDNRALLKDMLRPVGGRDAAHVQLGLLLNEQLRKLGRDPQTATFEQLAPAVWALNAELNGVSADVGDYTGHAILTLDPTHPGAWESQALEMLKSNSRDQLILVGKVSSKAINLATKLNAIYPGRVQILSSDLEIVQNGQPNLDVIIPLLAGRKDPITRATIVFDGGFVLSHGTVELYGNGFTFNVIPWADYVRKLMGTAAALGVAEQLLRDLKALIDA